jgi:transposase
VIQARRLFALARIFSEFGRAVLHKIKQCRRARYDKLAANYLAFIQLASISLWPRVDASTL